MIRSTLLTRRHHVDLSRCTASACPAAPARTSARRGTPLGLA
ncbi:hypothetical protein [Kineococcus sp. SYSU DK006]